MFNGREMLGERSMSDYRVKKNNTLFLVLRLRGGMMDDVVPAVAGDRLSVIEDRLAEIEVNYAVDQYVDERDSLLHDEIEEEVAVLHTHMDDIRNAAVDLSDRVSSIERAFTVDGGDLMPTCTALRQDMDRKMNELKELSVIIMSHTTPTSPLALVAPDEGRDADRLLQGVVGEVR